MMAALERGAGLLDRLPPVRGRYVPGAPLDRYTWFRVGGPAEVVFRPADLADLCAFLRGRPADVPVTVIGVGSNLLVRDGGVRGVVIRLGAPFAGIEVAGDSVRAGAGAQGLEVAEACRDSGLAGLEFLSGIPCSVGGALRMNAGAYGREVSDVLVEAEAVDGRGTVHRVPSADLGYSYRHCATPRGWIFVGALFRGRRDEPAAIARRMAEIAEARRATQPVRGRTGGSTFKNPGGADPRGTKAWQLVERAGCRGLRRGGALVSPLHCNFLIAEKGATAADIEGLGEEVRARVREACGVELEWEIERIGEPAGEARR